MLDDRVRAREYQARVTVIETKLPLTQFEGMLPWKTTSSGTGNCPCHPVDADYRK
jgi:hypothetical protein